MGTVSKCYNNWCRTWPIDTDVIVSVVLVDVYLLCALEPTVLHCNMLRYIAHAILEMSAISIIAYTCIVMLVIY